MDVSSWIDSVAARLLQTRSFVRAPIWLYRHGFGWLLGTRILMLEHTGRTSGLARYVCLEVVDHPAPDTILIVSGFGSSAQWYRNLRSQSACKVSIGRLRAAPAAARMLTDHEAAAALDRYRTHHPKAWDRLRGAIEAAVGHPIEGLPMVELTVQ